jgi:hypothetical protein
MEKPSYAKRIRLLMEHWNCLIEELTTASRGALPDQAEKYQEIIGQLIANREAVRRGLVELVELGLPGAASGDEPDRAPEMEENQPEKEDFLDRYLFHPDVTIQPKTRYSADD